MVASFALASLLTFALPFTGALVPVLLGFIVATSLPAGPIFSLLAGALSSQNRAVGI